MNALNSLLACWVAGLLWVAGQPAWAAVPTQDYEEPQPSDSNSVPPEVLRAIYPHRNPTVQHHFSDEPQPQSQESNYFDQAHTGSELQIGSSDSSSRPNPSSSFNENLFEQTSANDRAGVTAHKDANEANDFNGTAGLKGAAGSSSAADSGTVLPPDRFNAQLPPEKISNTSGLDQPDSERSDHFGASPIAPASHVADIEPPHSRRSALNRLQAVPATQMPEPFLETPRRHQYPEPTADLYSDIENEQASHGNEVSTKELSGRTLADLLAGSNENGSPAKAKSLRKKPFGSAGSESLNAGRGRHSTEPLTETLQRIAISLCLVLAVAFALLVIAKRWLLPGKPAQRTSKALKTKGEGSAIQILSQLKLDAKSLLYLVQANEQQILVAVDMTGIKSVVPLQADFGSALEDLSSASEELSGVTRERDWSERNVQGRKPAERVAHDRDSIHQDSVHRSSNERVYSERASRSIFQELEEELGQPALYTPAAAYVQRSGSRTQSVAADKPVTANARADRAEESNIESEMKRKLAELLRGSLSQSQK